MLQHVQQGALERHPVEFCPTIILKVDLQRRIKVQESDTEGLSSTRHVEAKSSEKLKRRQLLLVEWLFYRVVECKALSLCP